MFRIRQIMDCSTPANQMAVAQVQDLLRKQFNAVKENEVLALPKKLNDPLKYRFQTRLFVAEKGSQSFLGFALLLHVPDIGFCYLDFMAANTNQMGRGIGGALYERVRLEAKNLRSKVLLFECLPDDPRLSPDKGIREENVKRLAFYEKYGAYPIEGSLYETPLSAEDTDPPYIVLDLLGNNFPEMAFLRKAIRAILERKYGALCPKKYIEEVVDSFQGTNVGLRPPRYLKKKYVESFHEQSHKKILFVANEGHEIHHVKERGYVESPVRIKVILREIEKLSFMERVPVRSYPDRFLLGVHDNDYVRYLKKACASVTEGKSVYPYVFPIRNALRKPKEMTVRAGYYCIDTFTPLNTKAYKAARSAVDCVLTAADILLSGSKAVYALVRPPGHHAERKTFGGFCYFANSAIAANYLAQYGKVAILDIDYHHGNGQQDIFYDRNDVLTVSLHGHPSFAYPYFTGFEDERGEGLGYGYNLNIPLPEHLVVEDYLRYVARAVKRIKAFNPVYFIIAFGLDTAKADPTGTWSLINKDFKTLGAMIGELSLPTLVVQEGGYRTRTLGINSQQFFVGLQNTIFCPPPPALMQRTKGTSRSVPKQVLRRKVHIRDVENIRNLVKSAGTFNQQEVLVAGDLVMENVLKGSKGSGYYFSIMEKDLTLVGYACYGPIPFTKRAYSLYWIVVHPEFQRNNIAQSLLSDVECFVLKNGGDTVYAETSSSPAYAPARAFYAKNGFVLCSEYPDFYDKGDAKIVYRKCI